VFRSIDAVVVTDAVKIISVIDVINVVDSALSKQRALIKIHQNQNMSDES